MNNRFPTRRWCIINSGDVGAVNFGQVLENSAQTCRYSIDGTKTFVKYNITEFPQSQGTDEEGNVLYGDNVDAAGNTYNFYYLNENQNNNFIEINNKSLKFVFIIIICFN